MPMTKEKIGQLFRQHYPRMYQLALVLLKDEAASKDVVSDVFAELIDARVSLRPDTEGSYLLVCVRNRCLTLINRQKMKYREIATELSISEVAVYKHLSQGIKKLKQKFNP